MTVEPAIAVLAALGLATGVARSSALYALVSASHVLGIALLVGPILIVDARNAFGRPRMDPAALAVLRNVAIVGVLISAATGLLLFTARPAEYLANPAMLAKLAVVALAIVNALAFEWRASRHDGELGGVAMRGMALASMVLWLSALLLGRWVAFV